jgi:hypothetical protein
MKQFSIAMVMFLLFSTIASANPPRRSPHIRQRINVRVGDGYQSGIIFHSFRKPSRPLRECFPYSCAGIGVPQTNPKPRKEDEKPACYYGTDNVLFYEKEGSVCPYKASASPNAARIAARKKESLDRTDSPE